MATRPADIASRIARRYCELEHMGSMPCGQCAMIRAMVMEAFEEFFAEILTGIDRNRRGDD